MPLPTIQGISLHCSSSQDSALNDTGPVVFLIKHFPYPSSWKTSIPDAREKSTPDESKMQVNIPSERHAWGPFDFEYTAFPTSAPICLRSGIASSAACPYRRHRGRRVSWRLGFLVCKVVRSAPRTRTSLLGYLRKEQDLDRNCQPGMQRHNHNQQHLRRLDIRRAQDGVKVAE